MELREVRKFHRKNEEKLSISNRSELGSPINDI